MILSQMHIMNYLRVIWKGQLTFKNSEANRGVRGGAPYDLLLPFESATCRVYNYICNNSHFEGFHYCISKIVPFFVALQFSYQKLAVKWQRKMIPVF